MITLRRITSSSDSKYRFTEELLTSSFPIDEYRELSKQRENCDANRDFHLMIAEDGNTPVGFISWWQFNDFCYVEHLAVASAKRNMGYGKAILELIQHSMASIVLEVELPDDELSSRRIAFYKRMGFKIINKEYIQPAYRKESNELPMYLMFWGNIDERDFEYIQNNIHRTVYNKQL